MSCIYKYEVVFLKGDFVFFLFPAQQTEHKEEKTSQVIFPFQFNHSLMYKKIHVL